ERRAHAGPSPVVLHLGGVGEPVAVDDLADLEAGAAEVAVFHALHPMSAGPGLSWWSASQSPLAAAPPADRQPCSPPGGRAVHPVDVWPLGRGSGRRRS